MALTPEEVRKIASLARLRFTPEEEALFTGQLGRIVDYVGQLESFAPAADTAAAALDGAVQEAADVARPCLPREVVLANAPASALGEFVVVPEVKGGVADE